MRVKIPEFETKQELFTYLKDNEKKLISDKSSMPIYSEAVKFGVSAIKRSEFAIKSVHDDEEDEDKEIQRVKVVANTAMWLDSHMDILLPNSAKKSIRERRGMIPHLHDHLHRTDGKIGEVVDITLPELSFSDLGIKGAGSTQAIVFVTDVMKLYNEKIFNQYKQGGINQHSIGLQYINLSLAINDENSAEQHKVWKQHIDDIINKEKAIERGFFWAVKEIRLIENSAVLFGSNEITPTLDNNVSKSIEPEESTQVREPSSDTHKTLFNHITNNF